MRWGVLGAVAVTTMALGSLALAHNDKVTHTLITESALAVIEAEAQINSFVPARDAYAELSSNNRARWGEDFGYTEQEGKDKGTTEYARRPFTVVAGSALEDAPFTRVGTHFRNAYTGEKAAVTFGDPYSSALVGHRYFDQAIEVFGYEESDSEEEVTFAQGTEDPVTLTFNVPPSKELGLFLLGHALHHVEDSSSIAHAHNDLHLTFGRFDPYQEWIDVDERDDFEASYIPTMLWDFNAETFQFASESLLLAATFPRSGEATGLRPAAVDDFTDIWAAATLNSDLVLGASNELINTNAGLSRSVVNLTVFQGVLDPMPWSAMMGCAESNVQGELREMFDQDGDTTCSIHFNYETLPGFGAWCITGEDILVDGVQTPAPGIGCYGVVRIQQAGGPSRAPILALIGQKIAAEIEESREGWWPMSRAFGPRPDAGGDYFYIEQLMQGVASGEDFDQTKMVRPPGLRANLGVRYDPNLNQVQPNVPDPLDPSFGQDQPESLLESFAERLLPLSIEYTAGFTKFWYDVANLPPYLKKVTVEQMASTRYEAEWIDRSRVRSMKFINENLGGDESLSFNYVYERNFVVNTIRHIDPAQPFKIILEFNEPVVEDGQLGLQISLDGTPVTPASMIATPVSSGDKWQENREWVLEIDNLPGGLPEGEVTLTVQAYDRNYHWNNTNRNIEFGASLDEMPGTPARRRRLRSTVPREDIPFDEDSWGTAQWLNYPWHTADRTVGSNTILGSVDVAFPEMEPGDFAYDRDGAGDINHVLLFDNAEPEAMLGVQK